MRCQDHQRFPILVTHRHPGRKRIQIGDIVGGGRVVSTVLAYGDVGLLGARQAHRSEGLCEIHLIASGQIRKDGGETVVVHCVV